MKIKGTVKFTETTAGEHPFSFDVDTAKLPQSFARNPILDAAYLLLAYSSEPSGATCGFCGKPNDMADDCGFWYLDPEGKHESKPCCRECAEGVRGLMAKHQAIYGVGER